MMKNLKYLTLAGAAMAAVLAPLSTATADGSGKVVVGLLHCEESDGWGMVLGSTRKVSCVFTDADNHSQAYDGRITKLGVDIGYHQSGVIIWTVLAPAAHPEAGVLAGDYGGVDAGASAGIGAEANALVGGSDRSITLQPVSFEGLTGVNVAGGVEGLTLAATP